MTRVRVRPMVGVVVPLAVVYSGHPVGGRPASGMCCGHKPCCYCLADTCRRTL